MDLGDKDGDQIFLWMYPNVSEQLVFFPAEKHSQALASMSKQSTFSWNVIIGYQSSIIIIKDCVDCVYCVF